jgi:ATP-dependent DNA helicase DinG
MTLSLSEVFSPDGPLAAGIPGYRQRAQQVEMAERIAAALAANRVLVAEAGTGTGKTFAYLIPALLSGGKIIVSTGTKNLQDQLFARDIPTVRPSKRLILARVRRQNNAHWLSPP